jgi:hypothetical protein
MSVFEGDGFSFWINNPDFRLIKKEDPNNPEWCAVARPLVEWGDSLVGRLAQDPVPGKVGFAKWKLLDRYARLYHRTTDAHRPELSHNRHHCIHEALLLIWQKLEDVELAAAIPELEPPLRLSLEGGHRVIEGVAPEPEPTVAEYSGIIIGHDEDEPGTSEEDEEDG